MLLLASGRLSLLKHFHQLEVEEQDWREISSEVQFSGMALSPCKQILSLSQRAQDQWPNSLKNKPLRNGFICPCPRTLVRHPALVLLRCCCQWGREVMFQRTSLVARALQEKIWSCQEDAWDHNLLGRLCLNYHSPLKPHEICDCPWHHCISLFCRSFGPISDCSLENLGGSGNTGVRVLSASAHFLLFFGCHF